jgi:hypothetical protein
VKHVALALTLCFIADAACAQAANIPESAYRKGEPETIVPPPPPAAPMFNTAAFKAAYNNAGRPTIALLWNRAFSDMLQQGTAQQTNIDSGALVAGRYSNTAVAVKSTVITEQNTKTTQAERAAPTEKFDWQMRSAFTQAMIDAGTQLVDRNVIMRTTAADQKGTSPDTQQIETEALAKHAALLVEVLNTRDSSSATGWATYVTVKRLKDGIVLMEGYLDGNPPPKPIGSPKYQADPRGGFKEVHDYDYVQYTDVGRRLAEQTMTKLADALSRPR